MHQPLQCHSPIFSGQSCTHQVHHCIHLVVAVQGFSEQATQSCPVCHWHVLGLIHALGKVAVDVGLGEHQLFIEILERQLQPWGSAVRHLGAPLGCRTPLLSTTYLKGRFADVGQQLLEAVLIVFIDKLVSIHPLCLVKPETHQVHRGFQAFGGGEEQPLTNKPHSPQGYFSAAQS